MLTAHTWAELKPSVQLSGCVSNLSHGAVLWLKGSYCGPIVALLFPIVALFWRRNLCNLVTIWAFHIYDIYGLVVQLGIQ